MSQYNLDQYVETEKQREFDKNFIEGAEDYEVWEEVEIGETHDAAQSFVVKEEDLRSFANGAMDDNPVMQSMDAAQSAGFEEIVEHPMFISAIAFWCIEKGPYGDWIRTPGAMNPGQHIERFERFEIGEEITIKQTPVDKKVKNGLHHLTSKLDFYNQDDDLKAQWWGTLILPPTREDLLRFQRAEELASDDATEADNGGEL
jgi:acyl dehydratase